MHRIKILGTLGYKQFKRFGHILGKAERCYSVVMFPFPVDDSLSLCASLIEALFVVTWYSKIPVVYKLKS